MTRNTFSFAVYLLCVLQLRAQGDSVIRVNEDIILNPEGMHGAMVRMNGISRGNDSILTIVHFGDSHIQGDNFTGEMRNNFGTIFGSCDEGIMFPYSACKSFGPVTMETTTTGNWNYVNVLKNPSADPIGITGYTLFSKDKHDRISFRYKPKTDSVPGSVISRVTIWHGADNYKLILLSNGNADSLVTEVDSDNDGLVCTRIYNYRIGTELQLAFDTTSTDTVFYFHGISFERSHQRIIYHRCGVVGATFQQLIREKEFTLWQLHAVHPDLLIFSYGSNESYDKYFDSAAYYKDVNEFIRLIRNEFPGISIVFTNTPDTRSRNRYPVNTRTVNEALRRIANENTIAYWDLNKVMGGDNSIIYWLNNDLGRKDKLHFTKKGYTLQADLFTLALMKEYLAVNEASQCIYCDTLAVRVKKTIAALASPGSAPQMQNANTSGEFLVYYVRKNDTLSTIAQQHHVTVSELCQWNHISERSALKVNQKLLIKKK